MIERTAIEAALRPAFAARRANAMAGRPAPRFEPASIDTAPLASIVARG